MLAKNPAVAVYKVDRFTVPSAALTPFTARLRQIQRTLGSQTGCRQNLVLSGAAASDGSRELVTIVEWESEASFVAARSATQQSHADEGFDPAAFMQQLGVIASMGVFRKLEPATG